MVVNDRPNDRGPRPESHQNEDLLLQRGRPRQDMQRPRPGDFKLHSKPATTVGTIRGLMHTVAKSNEDKVAEAVGVGAFLSA